MTMPNVPETPQTADSGAPRREGFNLSAVALRYRQVTLFFLLICGIGGALAFFSLGQRENPDYTPFLSVIFSFFSPTKFTKPVPSP